MHNLWNRFVQFTDQKKSEMVQTAQINFPQIAILSGFKYKLMLKLLHIFEICYMIQRINSYNLLTDKMAEKVP